MQAIIFINNLILLIYFGCCYNVDFVFEYYKSKRKCNVAYTTPPLRIISVSVKLFILIMAMILWVVLQMDISQIHYLEMAG